MPKNYFGNQDIPLNNFKTFALSFAYNTVLFWFGAF